MNETEHLLTVLAEESAEVGQVACKAIRFGLGDIGPELTEDNRRRLERELADVVATAELLGLRIRDEDKATKRERLKKYMAYAREVGTLEGSKLNPAGTAPQADACPGCFLTHGPHRPDCTKKPEIGTLGGWDEEERREDKRVVAEKQKCAGCGQSDCPTIKYPLLTCYCDPAKGLCGNCFVVKQVESGPKCGSCDKPIVGHPYCYDCYRET